MPKDSYIYSYFSRLFCGKYFLSVPFALIFLSDFGVSIWNLLATDWEVV